MPWLTSCTQNMLEKWQEKEDKERLETYIFRTSQGQSLSVFALNTLPTHYAKQVAVAIIPFTQIH